MREEIVGFVISYQWEIFIVMEVLSIVALLLFGFVRYFMDRPRLSIVFITAFLALLSFEALLALMIYQKTGEFSTFQIVIVVFILYACTFGIGDFKKLDRWMRKKIGQWRDIELLTEKDYRILARNQDPKYIAKKYRRSSMIHFIIFIIVQGAFWFYGTTSWVEMIGYLRDLSWIEVGNFVNSPYPNEVIYGIGMIWGIVFIVDFIWSWSYTIFPAKRHE